MAALAVAATARSQFVLDPARAALDPRHEMLGGGCDEADLERSATPDTLGPVAIEDDRHAFASIELPIRSHRVSLS